MHETSVTIDPDADPELRIAALLAVLDTHRRRWNQQSRVGTADRRLLWLFRDHLPRTMREIAAALGLEQSTVNRQVNAAVKAGLLQRSRDGESAAYRFEPTAHGREAFGEDVASGLRVHRVALDRLGAEDTDQMLGLLGQFVESYAAAVRHELGDDRD
ncbi:MAG TPA: MarR family winged helix-turn-helix transcriptional regulator [Cellulomonas sp.]